MVNGKPKRSVGSSNTKIKYKPSEIDEKWVEFSIERIKTKKQKSGKTKKQKSKNQTTKKSPIYKERAFFVCILCLVTDAE
ncbi:hypothetical protein ACKUSY_13660 [Myroides odoratus]